MKIKLLESNFTSTLHILQVLHGWVGGACQAMADGKTNTETLHKPRERKPSAHLYPDSQPCVRKKFSDSFIVLSQWKTTLQHSIPWYASSSTNTGYFTLILSFLDIIEPAREKINLSFCTFKFILLFHRNMTINDVAVDLIINLVLKDI